MECDFFGVLRSTYSWSVWEGFWGRAKNTLRHINGKSKLLGVVLIHVL